MASAVANFPEAGHLDRIMQQTVSYICLLKQDIERLPRDTTPHSLQDASEKVQTVEEISYGTTTMTIGCGWTRLASRQIS
jgi:hypothetical protein